MSANTTDHYWRQIEDRWGTRVHLKRRTNIYSGATPSRDNEDYWVGGTHAWIGSGEVNQGVVTEPTALITDLAIRDTSTKLMREGALIIALAGQGKTKGTVAQLGINCFGNQSLSCIDARTDDDRFLYWWLTSLYRQIRGLASDDSRDGLNQEMVGSIPIPLVDVATQKQIANYLDRETARIDGLIAEKERMLALLEEKRAALISRIVTRGLDSNVPLKPSGQEWLGEIPAHWEVRTLKRSSSRIDTGTTPAASFMDGSLPSDFTWFTPSDFEHGGVIAESNRKIPQEAVDEGKAKVFPAHSLMVIGIGATLGKVASSHAMFSANQQINVITTLESVRWDYLLYVLQGYERVFRAHANSATLPILNQERLGVIRVPVPPLSEQDEIVTRLNESRAEYAEVSQLLGGSISLLKERRAALITAAVTGQIPLEEMTG